MSAELRPHPPRALFLSSFAVVTTFADGTMPVRKRGSFAIVVARRKSTPSARRRRIESGGSGGGPVK